MNGDLNSARKKTWTRIFYQANGSWLLVQESRVSPLPSHFDSYGQLVSFLLALSFTNAIPLLYQLAEKATVYLSPDLMKLVASMQLAISEYSTKSSNTLLRGSIIHWPSRCGTINGLSY